jgi:predicted NUDIX family phosphoesterase
MEHVFVVDRGHLFDDESPHGFVSAGGEPEKAQRWIERIDRYGYFAERGSVENDPSRKQIIPYSIVTDGSRILLLRRLSGGGEERLHHLYSVGVGGHINTVDQTSSERETLQRGARRELLEEISLHQEVPMEIVGFVNDDSNPVGSVHFGVVFAVHSPDGEPTVLETAQLEGRMVDWQEAMDLLAREPDAFETWSRIVLKEWKFAPARGAHET